MRIEDHMTAEEIDSMVIDITEVVESAPILQRSGRGPLHGKVAVVTGGAGGVGRQIALDLAALGARVCVIGREVKQLRQTVELAGPASAVLYLQCDLGSVSEIEGVVDFIERFDRPIDFLVHAEGVQVRGGVSGASVTDLDEQYLVNVRGPYVMSQRLLAQLQSSRGHVFFLATAPPAREAADFGQLDVANQGLSALAAMVRRELEPSGGRVTTIVTEGTIDAAPATNAGGPMGVDEGVIADAVVHAALSSDRVEISEIRLRVRPAAAHDSSV